MEDSITNELWIIHEKMRGIADVFGKAVGADPIPPYITINGSVTNTEEKRALKENIAYYEGFCHAAITVLETKKGG